MELGGNWEKQVGQLGEKGMGARRKGDGNWEKGDRNWEKWRQELGNYREAGEIGQKSNSITRYFVIAKVPKKWMPATKRWEPSSAPLPPPVHCKGNLLIL